jgi:hypothetical protein
MAVMALELGCIPLANLLRIVREPVTKMGMPGGGLLGNQEVGHQPGNLVAGDQHVAHPWLDHVRQRKGQPQAYSSGNQSHGSSSLASRFLSNAAISSDTAIQRRLGFLTAS